MSILNWFKPKEEPEPDYIISPEEIVELKRWRQLREFTEYITQVPLLAYTDYLPASWHIVARQALQTNDDELIKRVYHTMTVCAIGTGIKQQRIDDLFGVKIKEWKVQKMLNDIKKDFV